MKKKANKKTFDQPYNDLPLLPPARAKIETILILRQLVKSSVALAELKGIAQVLPNPAILLNAVILQEASASSEIENIVTTQDRLYQALSLKNSQVDANTKEVLNYREAILFGFRFIQKKGFISTNSIIAMQKILEGNNAGIKKLPGTALKNAQTGETVYTPPDDHATIVRLIMNLEKYLNVEDDLSPLIKLAVQHYQFESIHPFYDGNGRTGRIINVLYLILHGLLESPILYLSSYIIAHKADYYRLLQEVREKDNWEEWILYILKAIEETARQTVFRIKEINQLFVSTFERMRQSGEKALNKELLEILFEHPYCKIEHLVQRMGISRITASKYLRAMEEIGILQSRKVWKETIYINAGLFELLRK